MFFFSSRRRHTRYIGDWSSDVCSSDLSSSGGLALASAGSRKPDRQKARKNEQVRFELLAEGRLMEKDAVTGAFRSEERRVGKECRSRWSQYREKGRKRRIDHSGREMTN